jgi:hypothetical protein
MTPEMWDEPQFYFCLNHREVEDGAGGCANEFRLGPFDTREAAAGALELARQRTEQWEAEERADRGEDEE